MSWNFQTMIVPAALAALARGLAAGLEPEAGAGMFTTALSTNGSEPASHYVSTGMIDDAFAPLLQDAAALRAACVAAGADVPLAQCQALVSQSDVSDDPPFDAFARLGLQLAVADVDV